MDNGSIRRLNFSVVLCGLFLVCGCFFAFSGTGNYEYEGETGTPENPELTVTLDGDSIPIPETLDDEFDLIDDPDLDSANPEVEDNGKSKTECDFHQHSRAFWWWCIQELERDNCPFCTPFLSR